MILSPYFVDSFSYGRNGEPPPPPANPLIFVYQIPGTYVAPFGGNVAIQFSGTYTPPDAG